MLFCNDEAAMSISHKLLILLTSRSSYTPLRFVQKTQYLPKLRCDKMLVECLFDQQVDIVVFHIFTSFVFAAYESLLQSVTCLHLLFLFFSIALVAITFLPSETTFFVFTCLLSKSLTMNALAAQVVCIFCAEPMTFARKETISTRDEEIPPTNKRCFT